VSTVFPRGLSGELGEPRSAPSYPAPPEGWWAARAGPEGFARSAKAGGPPADVPEDLLDDVVLGG
jgi:hypothetical protein